MTVDGTVGEVRIEGVVERPVVTAFLETADREILLLRRSERVGSFPGRWAAVSGYLEDPTPLEQALREIREETGLHGPAVTLLRQGAVVAAREGTVVYLVHPFLFRAQRRHVRLDWEHTEAEWVDPAEILRRSTVPKLAQAWESVAAPLLPNDNSEA